MTEGTLILQQIGQQTRNNIVHRLEVRCIIAETGGTFV